MTLLHYISCQTRLRATAVYLGRTSSQIGLIPRVSLSRYRQTYRGLSCPKELRQDFPVFYTASHGVPHCLTSLEISGERQGSLSGQFLPQSPVAPAVDSSQAGLSWIVTSQQANTSRNISVYQLHLSLAWPGQDCQDNIKRGATGSQRQGYSGVARVNHGGGGDITLLVGPQVYTNN